ncbi:MAG: hypothetical protein U0359_05510 [Byssovorax sp.]
MPYALTPGTGGLAQPIIQASSQLRSPVKYASAYSPSVSGMNLKPFSGRVDDL